MKLAYDGQNHPKAFKEVLSARMAEIAREDKDVIYLDADLMSCIGTLGFSRENPSQAINCGIAEANMIGVGCGLSAVGFKPYIHTFGPFASRRCHDQVFLSAGYARNNITIIGTDPGVCAAFNGGTHMPFEDVGVYRAIPNATVLDITDATMLHHILPRLKDMEGVKYLRVGRKYSPKVYQEGESFELGKAKVLHRGEDLTIVSSGIMVAKALGAVPLLKDKGINPTVIDMFTIKPLDESTLLEWASKTGTVLVAENHNRIGGLTSAVCESLSKNCPTRVDWVAVDDEFGEVGPQDYLEKRFGLTTENILHKGLELVASKK